MPKAIVLTCAFNYRPEQMLPFFHSLRLHFDGDIVVFSDMGAEGFANQAEAYRLRVMRGLPQHFGPAIDRFKWASDFLAEEPDVGAAFFTDLRDVMFQASPFSLAPRTDLELFLEPWRIENCPMNRKWLLAIYGAEAVAPFIGREICCVGTTRGTREAMQRYFARMATEFERLSGNGLSPFWGWDQAVHNFLAYTGRLGQCSIHRSGEGLVQTLHYERHFCFDRAGRLLNRDGKVCPVIHQYDRTQDLFGPAYRRNILGPQPVAKAPIG